MCVIDPTGGARASPPPPDHDEVVKNDTTPPRRTKRAIKNIRAGRVSFHPRTRNTLCYYAVAGDMFHPKQTPYLWLAKHGYSQTDGANVVLTEKGRTLREALLEKATA